MTEDAFLGLVGDLLTLHGFLWTHARPARTARGWRTATQGHIGAPDILAVGHGRVLHLELKAEKGRLSPEQLAWYAKLDMAGAEVHVVRPSAWARLVQIVTGSDALERQRADAHPSLTVGANYVSGEFCVCGCGRRVRGFLDVPADTDTTTCGPAEAMLDAAGFES